MLLIQGVGVHGDGWLPQTSELSSRFQCLWFDNRGMGKSQPVGAPVTVEQMAGDAAALMDACGWRSAHLVGHSLGGLVAQHLALTDRPRVKSLALICTFARGRDVGRSGRMVWLGMRTRIGTRRMKRRAFLEMVMPPDALRGADRDRLAETLRPLFGHDLAEHPAIVMPQLRALAAYDSTPRLGELAGLPTLVVSASHDPVAEPRFGEALARGIPGARFECLTGASHGVTIHDPGRINDLLSKHFARV